MRPSGGLPATPSTAARRRHGGDALAPAGLAGVALVAGAAALGLAGVPGGGHAATTRSPVVLAGQAGALAVGLEVAPSAGGSLAVRATVLDAGGPRAGLRVAVRSGGRSFAARACGRGCYRARVRTTTATPRLAVEIRGAGRGRRLARFESPQRWPAPDATALVRRAAAAFARLRTVTDVSHLASDPAHAVTTIWRFQAPDRLSYRNLGGSEAVVVGRARWDRERPGAPWRRSVQQPVRQPRAPWPADVRDAHVLGAVSVDGQRAVRVSFVDPQAPAWYAIDVARASGRTLRVDMIASAHFMHDRYAAFDGPALVEPPA